jgi:hypothetical protein
MPGIGGNPFNHPTARRNESINHSNGQPPSASPQSQFFPQHQPYNGFPNSQQMPPPALQDGNMGNGGFVTQSPVDTNFSMPAPPPMPHPSLSHAPSNSIPGMAPNFEPSFDPSNPALFNFDLASMNFGNHYGALEFGMLGHMATGAGDTPPSDAGTQRGSIGYPNQYSVSLGSFSDSPSQPQFPYNDAMISDWHGGQNIYGPHIHRKDGPHAFAIESSGTNFLSPEASEHTPPGMMFDESPTMSTSAFKQTTSNPLNQSVAREPPQRRPTQISTPQLKARSQLPMKSTKRTRDPSSIYTTVTAPHSYTSGFHSLIAYLQRRFAGSPGKTLTIAKSLASIRPSFIATTKTLNGDDLIFMEKCFQRTLFEYESFIEGVGTPTIVARRTGEIAAVGKEFQILTGWKKDVLLGRSPNFNVNRGGETGNNSAGPGSGANTTGRVTGVNTPVKSEKFGINDESSEKKIQPVFLAELLDDDSVVAFYEDFARLAFGDSRGSVMGKGKLLKYRTKDEQIAQNLRYEAQKQNEQNGGNTLARQNSEVGANPHQIELKKENISSQKGMQKLGSKDGKVECTYCWTVKRDVFDIPMLIVMNVSAIRPSNPWKSLLMCPAVPTLHLGFQDEQDSDEVGGWRSGATIMAGMNGQMQPRIDGGYSWRTV